MCAGFSFVCYWKVDGDDDDGEYPVFAVASSNKCKESNGHGLVKEWFIAGFYKQLTSSV